MKLSIVISLDNSAYQGEARALEIASNLNMIAQGILSGAENGSIRDSNGNTVGFFETQRESSDLGA